MGNAASVCGANQLGVPILVLRWWLENANAVPTSLPLRASEMNFQIIYVAMCFVVLYIISHKKNNTYMHATDSLSSCYPYNLQSGWVSFGFILQIFRAHIGKHNTCNEFSL